MAYNILHDIDETLHKERLATLWKQWRAPLLIGLVVALATLVGVETWRTHTRAVRAGAATAYWQATQAGANAQTQFEALTQSDDPTYRGLARLQLASLKPAAADTLLEALVHDRAAPQPLRDLAALQLGQRLMASDDAKAEKYLKDLAEAKGAFALMAHDLLGILAENQGKPDEAKAHYSIIVQTGDVGTELMHRARLRNEALSQ